MTPHNQRLRDSHPRLSYDGSPQINRDPSGVDLNYDTSEARYKISSKYVLGHAQRRALLKQNYIRSSKRYEKVLSKRELIPERIKFLIEDIALLNQAGEFDNIEREETVSERDIKSKARELAHKSEKPFASALREELEKIQNKQRSQHISTPEELWTELIAITRGHRQFSDIYTESGEYTQLSYSANSEINLGIELGLSINSLVPPSSNTDTHINVVWGLIIGLFGRSFDSRESENFHDIFSELERRATIRNKGKERQEDLRDHHMDSKSSTQIIKEVIEEEDHLVNPVLLNEIKSAVGNIAPREELYYIQAKSRFDKIKEDTAFSQIDQLAKHISSDLVTIQDRSVKGVKYAPDVFIYLTNLNHKKDQPKYTTSSRRILHKIEKERIDSDDSISNEYNTSTVAKEYQVDPKVVTELFNMFSSDLVAKPIVERPLDDNKQLWRLTKYGELVLQLLFVHGGEIDNLYWFIIAPEEITLYERQLIIDTLDKFGLID